jgi:hypothetical protein
MIAQCGFGELWIRINDSCKRGISNAQEVAALCLIDGRGKI